MTNHKRVNLKSSEEITVNLKKTIPKNKFKIQEINLCGCMKNKTSRIELKPSLSITDITIMMAKKMISNKLKKKMKKSRNLSDKTYSHTTKCLPK